jgi:hypothetical protein
MASFCCTLAKVCTSYSERGRGLDRRCFNRSHRSTPILFWAADENSSINPGPHSGVRSVKGAATETENVVNTNLGSRTIGLP